MKRKQVTIQGMTCNHCVMSVRKELEKIDGLYVQEVTIGGAVVEYDESKVTPDRIKTAIEEAGYVALG